MSKDLSRHLERLGPFNVQEWPRHRIHCHQGTRDGLLIAKYREAVGFKPVAANLVTVANQKLQKSTTPTFGLSLSPAATSGDWNTCRWSTAGCRSVCLATAGNGRFDTVTRGRLWKTRLLADHPTLFVSRLAHEIGLLTAKHGKINFRFNVLSDLRWELIAPDLLALPGVTAYDYTKAPPSRRGRVAGLIDLMSGSATSKNYYRTLTNYRLVGSATENSNDDDIGLAVEQFGSAAVVFDTKIGRPLPATYLGFKVIDGDLSDDRTVAEEDGCIVGLRAKGDARGVANGFVRPSLAT